MLAALALEPNNDNPDRPRLLGLLDLTSLLVCWTYVYLFWAMAYLLAGNDLARYNSNSDTVDVVGNQVFLLFWRSSPIEAGDAGAASTCIFSAPRQRIGSLPF